MDHKELDSRIFTPKILYSHLLTVIDNFSTLQRSRKNGYVSKAFSEKIMLAVSQVNGCRMCSYLHTKNAIDAGTDEAEIQAMLNGELGDVGNDESLALMYAQHYADTGGNPDQETLEKFVEHYGKEKAGDIEVTIMAIMVGNIHSIALDALGRRLKGKKMEESKLRNELGIFFGLFLMIPVAIVHNWFRPRKKERQAEMAPVA